MGGDMENKALESQQQPPKGTSALLGMLGTGIDSAGCGATQWSLGGAEPRERGSSELRPG